MKKTAAGKAILKGCDASEITYKKMFGDYCIYCNGKVIGVICDSIFCEKNSRGERDAKKLHLMQGQSPI